LAHIYVQLLRSLEEIFAETQLLARLLRLSKDNPLRDEAIARLGDEIDTIARGFATASEYFRDQADLAQLIDVQTRLAAFKDDPIRPAAMVQSDSAASLEDRRQISLLVGTISDIGRSLGSIVEAALDVSQVSPQNHDRATGDRRLAAT
jgi:hypothetical protein